MLIVGGVIQVCQLGFCTAGTSQSLHKFWLADKPDLLALIYTLLH